MRFKTLKCGCLTVSTEEYRCPEAPLAFYTDRKLIAMETHNVLFQQAEEDCVNMGCRQIQVVSIITCII